MRNRVRLLTASVAVLIAVPLAAQDRGQRGAAPAAPPMTLTVAGFRRRRRHSREVQPGGAGRRARRGTVAGDQLGERAGGHAVVRPEHARHGRRAQQDDRRSGALGRVEHSRRRRPACPKACRRGRSWPTAPIRSAPPARCIAGPARGANGPKHHYMFELYALDTTIDVAAGRRRLRDARQRDEGDAGAHAREGGLRRAVQAAAVAASAACCTWSSRTFAAAIRFRCTGGSAIEGD